VPAAAATSEQARTAGTPHLRLATTHAVTCTIAACHDALLPNLWDRCLVRPTVVIVDDHSDFRRSAAALLDGEGFDVIGEAADGADAIHAVDSLQPDIVLLDIQLPGVDGFVVAERLCAGSNPPKVVLISSRDANTYGVQLSRSPAVGFVRKSGLSGVALAELTR
jgi:DNA-binding NarL/FixJ family response regulator